jgi:hypothetical protein
MELINVLVKKINKHYKIILNQNYFQHYEQYYIQMGGLAMGVSALSIFSEVHLQPWEHAKIADMPLQRLQKICTGNKIYVTQ